MSSMAAIIPARGGSKGIPKKNLVEINGKPLVDYTIEFAKKLEIDIFLSTDCNEISERGRAQNIKCINRPYHLASDQSRIIDTLLHAANEINLNSDKYDSFLVLQPTFLIREVKEIKRAIYEFQKYNYESLVAISKMIEHPCECIDLDKNKNKWDYLVKGPEGATNRQEFKDSYYFITGNFYISTIKSLAKYRGYMHKDTNFFITKNKYFVDIDDYEDLDFAKSQIYKLKSQYI